MHREGPSSSPWKWSIARVSVTGSVPKVSEPPAVLLIDPENDSF
jgi:hypothetical protein